jgi:4-pyridoxate dehydrogenase
MTIERFDHVIVGGGSAGCVMANRLSEDAGTRVLLLEAGGRDINPLIHIPIGLGKLHEYKMHDWGYQSEPDPGLKGRRVDEMRGKVLGGSSSVNVMAFTRGDPADYDRWARNGAAGWSYADVLPYFKRVESWQDGANEFRGGSGHIGVQWAKTTDPLFTAWLEAAQLKGFPIVDDFNAHSSVGLAAANTRSATAGAVRLRPGTCARSCTVKIWRLRLKRMCRASSWKERAPLASNTLKADRVELSTQHARSSFAAVLSTRRSS